MGDYVGRVRCKRADTWHAWKMYCLQGNYKNMEEALRALLVEKGFLGLDIPRTF
jgi:hypothetical protein